MPVEGVFHNLVITKIRKDYAGQGQKVMNAMWGAGQMMFNKILVLADEKTSISNYRELAAYIFRNVNPSTDIYFSTGPMDVLDHSCSKLGFGGKMCIDGTSKMEEEQDENYQPAPPGSPPGKLSTALREQFSEIKNINESLFQHSIPCLLIAVEKNRPGHIRELHEKLAALPFMKPVKMILYLEHTVDPGDLAVALWRFCNNLDPRRDYHLVKQVDPGTGHYTACLGLDGTRKTKELDQFQRNWPNIIVASPETIKAVDAKWESLGLGPLIPSPSLKFRDQLYGEEAAVS